MGYRIEFGGQYFLKWGQRDNISSKRQAALFALFSRLCTNSPLLRSYTAPRTRTHSAGAEQSPVTPQTLGKGLQQQEDPQPHKLVVVASCVTPHQTQGQASQLSPPCPQLLVLCWCY